MTLRCRWEREEEEERETPKAPTHTPRCIFGLDPGMAGWLPGGKLREGENPLLRQYDPSSSVIESSPYVLVVHARNFSRERLLYAKRPSHTSFCLCLDVMDNKSTFCSSRRPPPRSVGPPPSPRIANATSVCGFEWRVVCGKRALSPSYS